MEARIARLNATIKARELELAHLKGHRKALKAWLSAAKKAAKHGRPLPPDPEPEGIAERLGTVLSEKVVEPITELLHPASAKTGT
jgi:hypothetical protein